MCYDVADEQREKNSMVHKKELAKLMKCTTAVETE